MLHEYIKSAKKRDWFLIAVIRIAALDFSCYAS